MRVVLSLIVSRGEGGQSQDRVDRLAIVHQTNIGTVSKVILGKRLRDGVECTWAFYERINIILNWTAQCEPVWPSGKALGW